MLREFDKPVTVPLDVLLATIMPSVAEFVKALAAFEPVTVKPPVPLTSTTTPPEVTLSLVVAAVIVSVPFVTLNRGAVIVLVIDLPLRVMLRS